MSKKTQKPNENKKLNTYKEKRDCDMAILAKPSNTMILIDKDKTQSFLEDYKKNLIKPEFLEQCKKYSSMFNRSNQSNKDRD